MRICMIIISLRVNIIYNLLLRWEVPYIQAQLMAKGSSFTPSSWSPGFYDSDDRVLTGDSTQGREKKPQRYKRSPSDPECPQPSLDPLQIP